MFDCDKFYVFETTNIKRSRKKFSIVDEYPDNDTITDTIFREDLLMKYEDWLKTEETKEVIRVLFYSY